MTIRERALTLTNDEGLPVRVDVRTPEGPGPFPVAVLLHGFKGFKNWGFWPPTAERLAERGLASVAVNSSRNGVGDQLTEFTELSLFAHNTPRREAKDVTLVVDAIRQGKIDGSLDASRLGLVGHSRGGGVVLLVASRDPKVKAVVTWASIASFDRWTERAKTEWRARGRMDVPNTRTGQVLWLERDVLEDMEASRAEYDLSAACRVLQAPLLVIHGEQDDAVELADGEKLMAWAGSKEKRLLVIPRTGHTFGAAHPWAGPPAAWREVVEATADWLTAHL